MTLFVIIERDSDADIVSVVGPFAKMEEAMAHLRQVIIPRWTKEYEDETGFKANVGFFGNGASDGTTCQYWLVKDMEAA